MAGWKIGKHTSDEIAGQGLEEAISAGTSAEDTAIPQMPWRSN